LIFACEHHAARACNELGDMFTIGEGVPIDASGAYLYYDQACGGGVGLGCYRAGVHHALGYGAELVDLGEADRLYTRACTLGEGLGCTARALLIDAGPREQRDEAQIRSLLQHGCELGDGEGCWRLGDRCLKGTHGPRDVEAGNRWLRLSCEAKSPAGCRELGERLEGDAAQAAFERGCEGGDAVSCRRSRRGP